MDIKTMIDAILKQKASLAEDDLLQMVREKKERVGAGYLTDQGALFLVAADLGITIEQPQRLEMSLKSIYAGARELTVIGRVMKIYPLKRYKRKDGTEALLRTLTVYDNDAIINVKFWDETATLPDAVGLKSGDAVKISKVYAKSGIDGKIVINAGARSALEPIKENVPHIRDLDALAIDVDEVTGSEENAVVDGKVDDSPRIMNFVNFRGEPSKAMNMQLAGTGGRKLRVVLWNVDEQKMPKVIKLGAKLRLTGVRAKRNESEVELHGDEGTAVELMEEQEEIELIPLRVVAVSKKSGDSTYALAIDGAKRIFTLLMQDQFAGLLRPAQMVECVPSKMYGTTLLLEGDAYVKVTDDDPAFPSASSLERKIKDIRPSQELYFVEALTLTPSRSQEIQVRDGSVVKYAETLLGDDTGEIKLVGWRETSRIVEPLSTGQRVKVYGVMAYAGRDGNTELRLKPFSSITKL